MTKRILTALACWLWLAALPLAAQKSRLEVGVDLAHPVGKLLGGGTMGLGGMVGWDMKHRFFPTIEAGYASDAPKADDQGVLTRSRGAYGRVGMDYNFLWRRAHRHMLLGGLRYGVGRFSYRREGGDNPFAFTRGNAQWIELCLGIRARVTDRIGMGWSLRLRRKLTGPAADAPQPHHVPGFGTWGASQVGVSYHIVYQIGGRKQR